MIVEKDAVVKTTKCLNCETEFEGKFCPECGQRADTGRFTVKFIFQNFVQGLLSNDGGVWFTIKNLFIRPGQMMIDIINGKRKSYFSPFPMLFLTLSLYVLIFTFTGSRVDEFASINYKPDNVSKTVADDKVSSEMVVKNHMFSIINYGGKIYRDYYTTIMVLTIPLYILMARWCYGKKNRKRYNWGEYCIPVVYATILVYIYSCVASICYLISDRLYDFFDKWSFVFTIIAYSMCFKKMLEFSVAKTVWRTVLLHVAYFTVVFVALVSVLLLLVFVYSIKTLKA